MGLFKEFVNQTRKPEGFLGKMMVNGMNSGHAKLADWGMTHLDGIAPADIAEQGCGGGRNTKELLKRYPKAKITALDYSPVSVEKSSEEKEYCDKGNYKHMAQILTSIALYETLLNHGKSEDEAYKITSEEMWKFLDPSGMQKLAKKSFFLPLMKKIVPFSFKKGSGTGWRYTWHKDDPKNEFHFECNECIYQKILGRRGLLKLGAMCCQADIINYSNTVASF